MAGSVPSTAREGRAADHQAPAGAAARSRRCRQTPSAGRSRCSLRRRVPDRQPGRAPGQDTASWSWSRQRRRLERPVRQRRVRLQLRGRPRVGRMDTTDNVRQLAVPGEAGSSGPPDLPCVTQAPRQQRVPQARGPGDGMGRLRRSRYHAQVGDRHHRAHHRPGPEPVVSGPTAHGLEGPHPDRVHPAQGAPAVVPVGGSRRTPAAPCPASPILHGQLSGVHRPGDR